MFFLVLRYHIIIYNIIIKRLGNIAFFLTVVTCHFRYPSISYTNISSLKTEYIIISVSDIAAGKLISKYIYWKNMPLQAFIIHYR